MSGWSRRTFEMVTTERLRSLAISFSRAGMWVPRVSHSIPIRQEKPKLYRLLSCRGRFLIGRNSSDVAEERHGPVDPRCLVPGRQAACILTATCHAASPPDLIRLSIQVINRL